MALMKPEDDPTPPGYMVWGTKVESLKLERNSKNVNVELTVVPKDGETLVEAVRRVRAMAPQIQEAIDAINGLHTSVQ